MVLGTPDYYRSVRETFGDAQMADANINAVASIKNVMVSINGKGIIYGGTLYLDYSSAQKHSIPILEIDDHEISITSFNDINSFSMCMENSMPFYILKYDDVNFIYSVGISRGITYEKGFRVLFHEKHGTTPTVKLHSVFAMMS